MRDMKVEIGVADHVVYASTIPSNGRRTISDLAASQMRHVEFARTSDMVALRYVTGKELGVKSAAPMDEIVAAANARGLMLLPAEAALALAEVYSDQAQNEVLMVASEPTSSGTLFCLVNGWNHGLCLEMVRSGRSFHPDIVWAFMSSSDAN